MAMPKAVATPPWRNVVGSCPCAEPQQAMPARLWLRMMTCARSGLEIADVEERQEQDEDRRERTPRSSKPSERVLEFRLSLVCDELREIIKIAETHINELHRTHSELETINS